MVASLKKNFEYKHAIRKNKPQEWWCVEPRPSECLLWSAVWFTNLIPEMSAKEKAQIEKCLKSFDPSSYTTSHGKIGFFHRLLSKIVSERIDRPHYQCNTLKKLRENFVDYLKLRKRCAKDLTEHKKKQKAKAAKEEEKEERKEAQKARKQNQKDKKAEKKAKKEAKEADARDASGELRRRFVNCQIYLVH